MSENEWKIAKAGSACKLCQTPFAVEQPYFSVVYENPEGLTREDFCPNCFQNKPAANVYYFWKTAARNPETSQQRLKPLVDIEYVFDFFKRLEGDTNPQRIAFRYILALMLSRKKVLLFEARKTDASGAAVQVFREKRGGSAHTVYEPSLTEEEIGTVSAELGVLLGLTPVAAPAPAAPVASAAASGEERKDGQGQTTQGATE